MDRLRPHRKPLERALLDDAFSARGPAARENARNEGGLQGARAREFEKVWGASHHIVLMAVGSTVPKQVSARAVEPPEMRAQSGTNPLVFEDVYGRWFHEVSRWVRAFGGLDADLDDLAQEVFIVVRRKLPEFDGGNLAGWLYRISQHTVRDYRRKAWYRRFLLRKQSHPIEEDQSRRPLNPAELLERREAERLLRQILGDMSATRRTAFILFEIEGYSGEEIAELESVPVNTVWTRLYHARKEFSSLIARAREEGRLP
jgi:RNA polymerase sigma-70 factor (ECF subfamily)